MNGEPSRRLLLLVKYGVGLEPLYLLVQEYFVMFFAGLTCIFQPSDTMGTGPRPLKKPAVAPNDIRHAILRRSVEF